jgi:hypothetical protein
MPAVFTSLEPRPTTPLEDDDEYEDDMELRLPGLTLYGRNHS